MAKKKTEVINDTKDVKPTPKAKEVKQPKLTDIFDYKRTGHDGYVDRFEKFLNGRNVNTEAKVVEISPLKYMEIVNSWRKKEFNYGTDKLQNSVRRQYGVKKWAIPVLDFTVQAYVGMHRAKVCEEMLLEKMPVLVIAGKDTDIDALIKGV